MGLKVPVAGRSPYGEEILMVDSDVLDVAARLRDGDPTLGWKGDKQMFVGWNVFTKLFEVWTRDAAGDPYVVYATPHLDLRAVREVARIEAASRAAGYDLAKVVEAKQREIDVAADADYQDWRVNELAPRMRHAIRRDAGQHYGGLTRTVYPVSDHPTKET